MKISLDAIGILAAIGVLTLVTFRLMFRTRIPKGLKLPPGPPGYFLIGNLRDVPSHHEWETYSKWHHKYGDLVYLNVLGTSLLYVNTAEMAYELLDKRSVVYSDRPTIPMLELTGWYWAFSFGPYGKRWRQHRQAFHQNFDSTVQTQYAPVQIKHSRNLLKKLLKSSDNWESCMGDSIGAIVMEIAYGINVLPENDPYIEMAASSMALMGHISAPGAYLVNVIPQLRYFPGWFPGAGFQKKVKNWRKLIRDAYTIPFQFVKKELASGRAKPSLATTLLENAYANSENQIISEVKDEFISQVAGMVFVGSVDSISYTLQIFVFAMILHPQAQLKAQKELDDIIGPDCLPSIEDRDSLPYVHALCKEVLRWHPLTPVAFPHRLMKDDIIGPYFIPAGTTVLANAWGMLHSENMYGPDTMAFKPERFLHSPDMANPTAGFGFGRRACPGRTMAENGLFITAAAILHVFNIALPDGATPLPVRMGDAETKEHRAMRAKSGAEVRMIEND